MKRIPLILALILLSFSIQLNAQNTSDSLTPDKPINAELNATDKHSYQLKLAASQTAHIVVMQQGVDVQVNVYDPAGKLLIEMDSPNAAQGPEPVWLINQPAGIYRIEVKPFTGPNQPARSGKYEIKLVELRAATPQDARLAQAQTTYLEGTRLFLASRTDDTKLKPAAAKLQEADKLLSNQGDPDLRQAVQTRLRGVAPIYLIQTMNLVKAPGMVTTYHSADLAKEAMDKRALLESLLNFYQPLLQTKFDLGFAMLNQDDWKRFCPTCPGYVVPMVTREPFSLIQGNDAQMVKGMLAPFKSKTPAALNNTLAAEGFSYDTAAPLVLDAAGYFYLAGRLRESAIPRLPKTWMNVVVEAYLVQAWLGEKHPALRKQINLGYQLPGAVLTPKATTLDTMFGNADLFTGGVGLSRAADLAADLYDQNKLGFLTELQKAFPKDTAVDAATAESRFIALSPLIKPWMNSFGYTGAALEVQQAEHALVALRKAKDAAAFDRAVADEYCGLNQFGQQRNKAGFRLSATQPTPVAVFNLDRTDIEIAGDLAIVRGAQTEQWQGNALEHHLFTRIWIKRDGRWQLLSNTQFIDPNQK